MNGSETLGVLLARLEREVEMTADTVRSIEVGAAHGRPGAVGLSDADLVDLQKLDVVEQTLRSLATVLAAIAASEASVALVDLSACLGSLPLAGLGDRLRGAPGQPDPAHGHVELF